LNVLLWPTRNKTFVPASELRISIYVWRNVRLNYAHRGWVGFINNQFSNPASRSASMPAAFCFRISQVTLTGYSLNVLAVFTRDLHRGTLFAERMQVDGARQRPASYRSADVFPWDARVVRGPWP
jgi:hypothetical protein